MELWYEYQRSGDQRLRDRLVLTYAPLVKFIVYRKIGELPASCEVDDLVSAGLEALIKSLDRYDPAKGATLEQFAWTRIHGAVIDELRRGDWAPRSLRRWERDMRRVQSEFRSIHGRAPPDSELADALNMTPDAADQPQARPDRLGRHLAEHPRARPRRRERRAHRRPAQRRRLHRSAARGRQDAGQGALPPRLRQRSARREREVAVLLYVKNLTLREIGEVLGVSESRVCQIHGELKKTLKRALADDAELLREVA